MIRLPNIALKTTVATKLLEYQALKNLKADLLLMPHPTVWAEMKRQRAEFAELNQLFQEIPEALTW